MRVGGSGGGGEKGGGGGGDCCDKHMHMQYVIEYGLCACTER